MSAADGSIQADAGIAKLRGILASLDKEVVRLLQQLDTESGSSSLASDKQALAVAARVREQVIAALESRMGIVLDTIEDATAKAADAAARKVKLGDFTPDVEKTLEEIASGQTDDVTKAFAVGRVRIGEAMRAAMTTSAPIGELTDMVAKDIRTTFTRASTAVETACRGAGRLVTIKAGDEGDTDPSDPIVYRYVGSDDAKTRPFCRSVLGKCFTREALDLLDNGTDLSDVAVWGGGYSCRHSLAPMLMSEAREAGYQVVS